MKPRTAGRRATVLALNLVLRLTDDESGATAVEYSLILGGIAAAIIVMIYAFAER
jgi:Flp pilus assembly pilin Flp